MNQANQSIYMFGGWDEKETLSTVFRFDIETQKYHFDGFLPKQVEGHACVHVPEAETVFLFGGYDSLGVTDRIMKYDMKNRAGSLVFGQKLSQARENHVAELIDQDKIIVSNGWNGHASVDDIEVFKFDKTTNSVRRFNRADDLAELSEEER